MRSYWSDPTLARIAFPVSMIYNCGYDILLNSNTLFYTLYLLCAVLGLAIHPAFYCFHLMDLIVVSPNLQNVVRAVTDPIQALSMTGLLGIFTIYIFALIGSDGCCADCCLALLRVCGTGRVR